jgi:small nuclear ribonucleoprotein D1
MKLTKLLAGLTNERVRVELKNGTVVQGTLVNVTPAMNMTLKRASMTLKHREPVSLDFVNVRGSTVRGIVLPDTLKLDLALQATATALPPSANTRKRRAPDEASTTKRARAL